MFRPLLPDEAPEVAYEPATFFASQDNQAYLSRKSLFHCLSNLILIPTTSSQSDTFQVKSHLLVKQTDLWYLIV